MGDCLHKAKALDAQADCGMVLVAHARTTGNEARFCDVVDPLTPALAQALATAGGARAADLLAHLGWADFLRSQDGNGMQLVHLCLIGQQLAQLVPRFLHAWILFGTPFADTWCVPIRTMGRHDQP